MHSVFLFALGSTGFAVAFLHAAIPAHWLPFVIVGRARGWSRRRIMGAVALAGGGHVLATTARGVACRPAAPLNAAAAETALGGTGVANLRSPVLLSRPSAF